MLMLLVFVWDVFVCKRFDTMFFVVWPLPPPLPLPTHRSLFGNKSGHQFEPFSWLSLDSGPFLICHNLVYKSIQTSRLFGFSFLEIDWYCATHQNPVCGLIPPLGVWLNEVIFSHLSAIGIGLWGNEYIPWHIFHALMMTTCDASHISNRRLLCAHLYVYTVGSEAYLVWSAVTFQSTEQPLVMCSSAGSVLNIHYPCHVLVSWHSANFEHGWYYFNLLCKLHIHGLGTYTTWQYSCINCHLCIRYLWLVLQTFIRFWSFGGTYHIFTENRYLDAWCGHFRCTSCMSPVCCGLHNWLQ